MRNLLPEPISTVPGWNGWPTRRKRTGAELLDAFTAGPRGRRALRGIARTPRNFSWRSTRNPDRGQPRPSPTDAPSPAGRDRASRWGKFPAFREIARSGAGFYERSLFRTASWVRLGG